VTNENAWETVKQTLAVGARVRCRVKEHHPFGIFTTLAGCPFDGLIQITDFKDVGRMTPTEYPPLGSEVEAVVLGFKERGRQIWLGVKPSQLSKAGDADATDAVRKVVPVGLRYTEGKGFEFFGIEEVNSHLRRGAAVIAIENGKAIMVKAGEADEMVRLRLGGFSLDVVVEEKKDNEHLV